MPIIVGGKVVDINSLQQPADAPVASARESIPEPTITETPKRVVFKSERPKIKDGNTLIVNGKKKTIGRKSQYLLDMMIIDDE